MADPQSTSKAIEMRLRGLSAKDWRDKSLDPNAYRKACQTIFRILREVRQDWENLPTTARDSIESQCIDLFLALATDVLYPLARRRGRPHKAVPKNLFTVYVDPLLGRCGLPCFKTYIASAAVESKTKGVVSLRAIAEILADLLPSGRRGRPGFRPTGFGILRSRMEFPDAEQVNKIAMRLLREGRARSQKEAVLTALGNELGSSHGVTKLDYYLKRLSEALKKAKRS